MFVVKLLNMHESALCVQWYVTAVHPSAVLVCKYSRTGSDRQVVVWIESASMHVFYGRQGESRGCFNRSGNIQFQLNRVCMGTLTAA